MHRLAALLIVLAALAGLIIQFAVTFGQTGSVLATVWVLLRFFTILTNLLVAVTMTRVAMNRRVSAFFLAGLTLAIVFVGIVYATLLHGLIELRGPALIADILLHYAVPISTAVYWLAFAPKIGLQRGDPLLWGIYPLAYLFYVIVRGPVDGRYPYPFIDVASLGYGRTILNSLILLGAYLFAGWGLASVGRALARRRGARGPLGKQAPNG